MIIDGVLGGVELVCSSEGVLAAIQELEGKKKYLLGRIELHQIESELAALSD
ncbi:MAG TPA: hypothetical protein VIK21_09930 [Desulfuromonadaceae bacterium]